MRALGNGPRLILLWDRLPLDALETGAAIGRTGAGQSKSMGQILSWGCGVFIYLCSIFIKVPSPENVYSAS